MTARAAIPPVLRRALRSPGGRCYRHCDRPIRIRRLSSADPGDWTVRACPGGVVSVVTYSEWSGADPTPRAARRLRSWTLPAARVRRWDLRVASRRGPELGAAAERRLSTDPRSRPIRTVYWRVYPFRGKDGTDHRLYVCTARAHAGPVFFAASVTAADRRCPKCRRAV